jgi:hypothetical protein
MEMLIHPSILAAACCVLALRALRALPALLAV